MIKFGFQMLLLPVCLLFCLLASCSTQNIYIVRHAEKDTLQKNDPPLTPAGLQRAQDLAMLLKLQPVTAVYSTNFARTLATAEPTAAEHHLAITLYDSIPQLTGLLSGKKNKVVLVTGHSNTIIPIAAALGTTPNKTAIDDADYDNLFIVRQHHFLWLNSLKLHETTYGNPTLP